MVREAGHPQRRLDVDSADQAADDRVTVPVGAHRTASVVIDHRRAESVQTVQVVGGLHLLQQAGHVEQAGQETGRAPEAGHNLV